MVKSVLNYLENAAELYGDKEAYIDENRTITFWELKEDAQKIVGGFYEYVRRYNFNI